MDEQVHSGLPWTEGPAPIIGEGWVQFGGTAGKKVYFDELSKADQDLIIQYLLSARFPVLAPPQTVTISSDDNQVKSVNMNSVTQKMDQARHDIIIAMLDSWLVNIQKIAEQNKRNDERRAIERMEIAFHEFKHQEALQDAKEFSLFAVGMIIVGTGIHQSILTDPTFGMVQINPVVSMYNHVITPVMGDMRAELGLIGAIFSAGVTYFSMAQVAASVKGSKPSDNAFARSHAENVLSLINSASFNQYLMAIVVNSTPNGQSLDPKRAQELIAMVKMVLLSSSLAMLYQAEAGRMTGQEFGGMLNFTIAFPENDIRSRLVALIHSNLKLLSPKEREKVLAGLLEYFDGDPSLDALADPSKVFAGLYENLPRGELAG